MSLFRRTFSCLKPYWGHIVVSSISAGIHAFAGGLLVWMAGPLLMTLFQVAELPDKNDLPTATETTTEYQTSNDASDDVSAKLGGELDFLTRSKNQLKDKINEIVGDESRKDTLINFCWLILFIALISNVFVYLQGFFMAYVRGS